MEIQQIMSYYIYCQTLVIRGVRVMLFNATFNNISVIAWWEILLLKETGGLGGNI
jgi:hypothetical protein